MISLGIIGTGTIAPYYIQAINWINKNKDLRVMITAAVNRTAESNERAKRDLKIPQTYNSIPEMLSNEELDGIVVAVPATSIYEITLELIPYKIPLLIEKPPGLTLEQTKHLATLAKHFQTSIMVGFNRRFYSNVQKAKEVIEEAGGLLGMRMDVFERYRMLKDAQYPPEKLELLFTGNSIHCIDLIRFYCGEPKKIYTFQNDSDEEPFNHRYAALVVSGSNIPVTFQAYWHAYGNWNYELYIPDGRIQFSNLEEARVFIRNKEPYSLLLKEEDIGAKPGFVEQMLYFINNVISESNAAYEGVMSIHDAIHTMSLVEALKSKNDK